MPRANEYIGRDRLEITKAKIANGGKSADRRQSAPKAAVAAEGTAATAATAAD